MVKPSKPRRLIFMFSVRPVAREHGARKPELSPFEYTAENTIDSLVCSVFFFGFLSVGIAHFCIWRQVSMAGSGAVALSLVIGLTGFAALLPVCIRGFMRTNIRFDLACRSVVVETQQVCRSVRQCSYNFTKCKLVVRAHREYFFSSSFIGHVLLLSTPDREYLIDLAESHGDGLSREIALLKMREHAECLRRATRIDIEIEE